MTAASKAPVTTLFARTVRAGLEERYEAWLSGVTQAASRFPGSQGTTILRPADARSEYLAVVQFESVESRQAWLDSVERAAWLSELRAIDVCRVEVSSSAGMERWFTLHGTASDAPPRHKTAALVLLGLYPVVLVLDLALGPLLAGLPGPLRLLVSLLASVSIMVGWVLPFLTRVFAGWLHPREDRART